MPKIINFFVIILSIIFAMVQYNDPDALLWIVIYLFVAFLAFQNFKGKLVRQSLLFIAFLFTLWGINQFPKEWEGVLLNDIGMKTLNIELGRESLGLFINAFCCILLSVVSKK